MASLSLIKQMRKTSLSFKARDPLLLWVVGRGVIFLFGTGRCCLWTGLNQAGGCGDQSWERMGHFSS